MAGKQKKQGQSQSRSQGGGRTSNSEPRIQVFREFGGCNFEESPRTFDLEVHEDGPEQSDLQMNYVVVQNNVDLTSSKTMQTRSSIVGVCYIPDDKVDMNEACQIIGNYIFVAGSDGNIYYGDLDGKSLEMEDTSILINDGFPLDKKVVLDDNIHDATYKHEWKSIDYYDDKLIAATKDNELWTGDIKASPITISNAKEVEDPSALTMSNLEAKGSLTLSATMTTECPFRTDLAYTYVNKYGPTKTSDRFTFYSSAPVDEWHAGKYLSITGNVPAGYDIEAIELYFSADNASTLLFLGRVDVAASDTTWTFNWLGYLDSTSMWPMGNLVAPTENYTKGVPASHMTSIDGRMFFWGNPDEPYRLYIGGNPGNLFSISPGTGGGFVDVEPGTGQEIRYVDKYKTQSGASIVTMLCDSKNSMREQRFNLVENTITISNEQSMKSWQAEQVAGAVGCKSYNGAKVCEDGLYSISRYGLALTTMTMEYNSQIQANYVSNQIKPVFTDEINRGQRLRNAVLLEADGIIYMALGKDNKRLDNVIFCYDINAKAWWTYNVDLDESVLNMIHIDYEGNREGIGIVTPRRIMMIPLTQPDPADKEATFDFLIETGELATQVPQQGWFHISQIEFCFDSFLGDMYIDLVAIDQFGRQITTTKHIHHDEVQYGLNEFMRVDLKLRSYKLIFRGKSNFRMTHFMAKVYTMSKRVGLVWGFDDSQSFRSHGDIHPTFKSYNDIRKAIIP